MTEIPENLRDPFDLITAIDPELAARMLADSTWVLRGYMEPALTGIGFGVTGSRAAGAGKLTELDPYMIAATAETRGISPCSLAATVMVHEYVHASQPDVPDSPEVERPAYAAGEAFALKLPGRDGAVIAAISRESLADVTAP
jgi:hypothetical protein